MAQPKGAKPLPPFQMWSFREIRYIQWLADQHAVHYALEAAVADATTVAATEHYGEISHLSNDVYMLSMADRGNLRWLGICLASAHQCAALQSHGLFGCPAWEKFWLFDSRSLYLHAHAAPKLCWSDDLGQGKGICDCR